jgi:Helix-turn-helix domain
MSILDLFDSQAEEPPEQPTETSADGGSERQPQPRLQPPTQLPLRPQPEASPSLVVRRRPVLAAALGTGALLLALGYLWRGLHGAGPLDWLVALALAAIAGYYLAALLDARTPLLVADGLGLRIRLGRQWVGLPWTDVASVDVTPRRGLRDGHVVVKAAGGRTPLEGIDRPAGRAAAANQKTYGAPMAVPIGLTTVASEQDPAKALLRLAEGRAEVVSAEPSPAPAPPAEPQQLPDAEPETEPMPGPEPGSDPEPDSTPEPGGEPAAEPTAARPRQAARSVLRAIRPGLRTEVTKPARPSGPLTAGSLALAEPETAQRAATLPEIAHLRRSGPGNVSVLVDGTDEAGGTEARPSLQPGAVPDGDIPGDVTPVIGPQLVTAREQLGLSVDDLAARTRIRPHVIEALEVDDFEPCGGDFYARGHLRALSRVLGIEWQPLVSLYDERYSTAPINPRTVFEADLATGPRPMIRGGTGGPQWGVLIAVVLALLMVWGLLGIISAR